MESPEAKPAKRPRVCESKTCFTPSNTSRSPVKILISDLFVCKIVPIASTCERFHYPNNELFFPIIVP